MLALVMAGAIAWAEEGMVGMPSQPAGAVLSINPRGRLPLLIPADFATQGGQAVTLGGEVRLLTAQSPDCLNRIDNPRRNRHAASRCQSPLYLDQQCLWPAMVC